MEIRRRQLSASERRNLEGLVSVGAHVARAVFFVVVVCAIGLLCWNLNRATTSLLWWPIAVVGVAVTIFVMSKRLTGGADLRNRVRKDLDKNVVEERVFDLSLVVVFPEAEDEGPVWVFQDGVKTFALSGQRVARLSKDGRPRERLTVAIAPASERIVGLKSDGQKSHVLMSAVPFFKTRFFDKRISSTALYELSVNWQELVASIEHSKGGADAERWNNG